MYAVRPATAADVPALRELIAESFRTLGAGHYTPAQVESALRYVVGVDTQLVADGTYYVVEADAGGALVAAGGWSRRRTLYGGDQLKPADDPPIDPATEPARIRAFFVHPAWTRRGLGRLLFARCRDAARAAGFRTFELGATLPGVPLYTALGFTAHEPIRHILPDGQLFAGVRMTRPIEPADPSPAER